VSLTPSLVTRPRCPRHLPLRRVLALFVDIQLSVPKLRRPGRSWPAPSPAASPPVRSTPAHPIRRPRKVSLADLRRKVLHFRGRRDYTTRRPRCLPPRARVALCLSE